MSRISAVPLRRGGAVAVIGSLQGSGAVLSPTMVLTCAHVVGSAQSPQVAVPGLARQVHCRVVWSDARLDAALLECPEGLFPGSTLLLARPRNAGPLVRMSRVATDRPLRDCVITGFPEIQRYDGRKLEADQYTGTVLPLAGLMRRTMVYEFDRPPAAERTDGTSPLAGLSGAPVYAGETLLGIVREIPRGRNHLRAECVPIEQVASQPVLREWFGGQPGQHDRSPLLERLTRSAPDDAWYEEEYAEALGAMYRKTRIFGLDELSRRDSEWDLDTAYLSLEARPRKSHDDSSDDSPAYTETAPRRIEDLLASRRRVLLRGDAGAGKTTLVWWLAAHAAAGTLDERLSALNGKVPFVVPLRSLRAQGAGFPAPARLPAVSRLVVDEAPAGWAGRVLESGRALLLVDGLDEVPHDDREEAHRWLSGLLARFPRTRCLVTVRPLAVTPDWLDSEDFEELSLLPMRDGDIRAFTAAWHTAARLDGGDQDTLRELERDLTQQFTQNASLRDLARTPLLCAVICALHRLRQGFLPETRWALYRSALEMLLGERDRRRRVDAPDGITLSVEETQQLLQRIAVWLARGGQSEFSREQALRQLTRALSGMPRVREQGSPEEILVHLLNRSGLLQERADDVFQFTHRTFQDYLAAKEFIEGDHLHELLRHCPDEQWHDILLLAAGHCSRRELPLLVHGLLDTGASLGSRGGRRRTPLYVLAALCAQHAAWLDSATHGRVEAAVKDSLLPGTTRGEREQLARLGPYLLPLLPEPADLELNTLEQLAELVGMIGGAAAIPYARRLARISDADNRLGFRLGRNWLKHPVAEYAREVLAHADLCGNSLLVITREQLACLPLLPHARHVDFAGDFVSEDLAPCLAKGTFRAIAIGSNHSLTDLSVLRSCGARLTSLTIYDCPALRGLDPLAELERLEDLLVIGRPLSTADLEVLARIPRLRMLSIGWPPGQMDRPIDLSSLHSVSGLTIIVHDASPEHFTGRAAFGDRLRFEAQDR
ncbi:NACHT domain-containing protein [Streptomyces sp. NPDC055078]